MTQTAPNDWIIEIDDLALDQAQVAACGWWILPMGVFGSLAWIGLFRLIFE